MSKILKKFYYKIKSKPDVWIILLLIIIFVATHSIKIFNINPRAVYDEGNYLYAAKLIAEGNIPYKDFAVGHMPLYLYILSIFFKLNLSLKVIHILHLIITSLIIIPVYLITKKLTNRKFSIIACLLLISNIFIFFLSRTIILDFPLTILITTSLYIYLFGKSKYSKFISGLIMGIATFIKITAPISLVCLIVAELISRPNKKSIKSIRDLILGYFVIFIPVFIILLNTEKFFSDIFIFHLFQQNLMPLTNKFIELFVVIILNFIIFLIWIPAVIFNLSKPKNKKIKTLSTIGLLGVIISLFAFRTFYAQHIFQFMPTVVIVVIYAIKNMYDKLLQNFGKNLSKIFNFIFLSMIIATITIPIFILRLNIFPSIEKENYIIDNFLINQKGNLYTDSLYLALRANRIVTPWHYVAVPDVSLKVGLGHEKFDQIIDKSSDIFLKKKFYAKLPIQTLKHINNTFNLVYEDTEYVIFEK